VVETDCGDKALELHVTAGKVESVTVDMGVPVLEGRQVPVDADGEQLDVPLLVDGRSWTVSCLSMGNPHCVTFDEDPAGLDLERIGPAFDRHEFFPAGVNTEFARVEEPGRLSMRVWERGSGETEACGTGACAVVVAGHRTGRCNSSATVVLKGGQLYIELREDGRVFMTGPAEESFRGTVSVPAD
jgi:diaminopimelate epimerase